MSGFSGQRSRTYIVLADGREVEIDGLLDMSSERRQYEVAMAVAKAESIPSGLTFMAAVAYGAMKGAEPGEAFDCDLEEIAVLVSGPRRLLDHPLADAWCAFRRSFVLDALDRGCPSGGQDWLDVVLSDVAGAS